ncbi:uncharacterized protein LOC111275310 [Durio zibethinus]|uniref:Uncharacterized protein LOC111275310 n=1 Tax=Durio zibethinus TaxID=66656 RepID=A0A6P5WK18_DURZI|nr:uncharacterized protein LOC111275310 [Durio zibethinus]XP_022716299.1 uncharacterized protein LOC111275310 [Durio zibethinus]
MGGLDFGQDIKLEPCKLLEKFQRETKQVNLGSSSGFNRSQYCFRCRKPQLALVGAKILLFLFIQCCYYLFIAFFFQNLYFKVFDDLLVDPQQLLMVTIATALREIGYEIQVDSLEEGPVHNVWRNIGVTITILNDKLNEIEVDWLRGRIGFWCDILHDNIEN